MARPPVIVTRPAAAGRQLREHLQAAGWPVLWLPAFDIAPAADVSAVQRALGNLAAYELVVFVSPHAVAAAAPLIDERWPLTTALGAVGQTTAQAALTEIAGAGEAVRIAPADSDPSGSEGFWAAWQASGLAARRVLIVRAQGGREWLADAFATSGAKVDVVAAYRRTAHSLDEAERQQLDRLLALGQPPLTVFSSSEAVTSLDNQLAALDRARPRLREGIAIATHSRIADHLRAAGYDRVVTTDADDFAVLAKLESLLFAS